jgi:hypothetical protein
LRVSVLVVLRVTFLLVDAAGHFRHLPGVSLIPFLPFGASGNTRLLTLGIAPFALVEVDVRGVVDPERGEGMLRAVLSA